MDIEHVRPFVQHTIKTFEMMLGISPHEEQTEAKEHANATYDVSAIIGLSGSGTGGVILSFPAAVACKVVSQMLGEELVKLDQDVTDGIGELVNIITGNAKRDLVKYGFKDLSVSLPNVVVGKHRTVWRSKDLPCLLTRFFTTACGPFVLEVNIRRNHGA